MNLRIYVSARQCRVRESDSGDLHYTTEDYRDALLYVLLHGELEHVKVYVKCDCNGTYDPNAGRQR